MNLQITEKDHPGRQWYVVDGKYSHEKIFDDLHVIVLMMPRGTALWSRKIVTTKNENVVRLRRRRRRYFFGNSKIFYK
jgi:hypothetical protein